LAWRDTICEHTPDVLVGVGLSLVAIEDDDDGIKYLTRGRFRVSQSRNHVLVYLVRVRLLCVFRENRHTDRNEFGGMLDPVNQLTDLLTVIFESSHQRLVR
jgi:hypothetical protein